MRLLFCLLGCAPTVEGAPEEFARTLCARSEECGWVEDVAECEADNAEIYSDWVNAEECPQGLDPAAWKECVRGLEEVACDDNVRGWGTAAQLCDAQRVCARD